MLSRCCAGQRGLDESPGLALSAAGAGLVVSFDFHDALTARIASEFLYAPTCLGFDTVLEITGPVTT